MTTTPVTTVPCWLCGDPLHLVANTKIDEYVWVDAAGQRMGSDPDLRHLPGANGYARLAFLAAELDRAYAAPKRSCRTWLARAYAAEYTSLKVRMDAGLGIHTHVPRFDGIPRREGPPPPTHCGWPAWLRPSGWQCRMCNTRLEEKPTWTPA